jgi:hypothetical protein
MVAKLFNHLQRADRFHPTLSARYRTRIEQRLRSAASDRSQAGPGPLLGSLHQTGPQRIPLDVPQNHQKVFVLLDQKGLEPALPDVSAGMVMPLLAPDMGCQEPVHPAAQVPVLGRPEGQVEMIGHQTIGQHPHGIPEGGLGNDLNERVAIAIPVKDLGAGITPVQDVVAETSGGSTGGAWHGKVPDESSDRGRA